MKKHFSIKAIYFYLISLIALIVLLFNLHSAFSVISRYYVFKTAPNYSWQPSLFQSYYFDTTRLEKPSLEQNSEELTKQIAYKLENSGQLNEEELNAVRNWISDYNLWVEQQADQNRRIMDALINAILALIIFTPVFYYHFRIARKL